MTKIIEVITIGGFISFCIIYTSSRVMVTYKIIDWVFKMLFKGVYK